MTTAYDLKALGEMLKAKGLIQAEDLAGEAYGVFKAWLKESAALSENKYDDLVIPFVDQLDAIVLPQIDKIDGAEG